MKGTYIFLADGFEISEALTTVNMLRRGGINVKTVSIYDDRIVITFNHKEGTKTVTFDEVKEAIPEENGSDLDCLGAPRP